MQYHEVTYYLKASAFKWSIAPGQDIDAWGFNQQLPGPVIRAKQHDTVIVHVKNDLPEPLILHWHGIRLPAAMNGTDQVQDPIAPGGRFTYRFTVPDAGTCWYHSHYNETVQMERGLYGAIIVEERPPVKVDRERVLLLDDMKLNSDNSFTKGNRLARWIERHDGREGSRMLVNGKEMPVFHMNAGLTERWRVINAASARYFRFHLSGKSFRLIGTDGGLLEQPQTMTELLLTPGERIDVLVGPMNEGEQFFIESLPYNRVTFVRSKLRRYARVEVGQAVETTAEIPGVLRMIPAFPHGLAVNRRITLAVGPSLRRGIDFLINKKMHGNDHPVRVGEMQVWELHNKSMMDHPFHLHGFFFQVLKVNGQPPAFRSWKDTVNVPPRSRITIGWMPDNRPGTWMYHCHILEHHEAGMMSSFEVLGRHQEPVFLKNNHHHHHHQH